MFIYLFSLKFSKINVLLLTCVKTCMARLLLNALDGKTYEFTEQLCFDK